eukprot:m.128879 g.128879  ORF g.128879 m.128879 type:complete len:217 (+) comp52298_c0_seq6:55-705(+)
MSTDDSSRLTSAVYSNKLEDCQQIVGQCGKQIITTKDKNEWHAVHWAASYDRPEILEWFLQQHIDLDGLSDEGNTALIYSARDGNLRCVRLLLEYGANTALTGWAGQTAIERAREEGHDAVVALLEEHERIRIAQQNIKAAVRASETPALPISTTDMAIQPLADVVQEASPQASASVHEVEVSSTDANTVGLLSFSSETDGSHIHPIGRCWLCLRA